jgi:hypothetical protein
MEFDEGNPSNPACQGDGTEEECGLSFVKTKDSAIRSFLHEFGHSFGGLQDEYMDEIISGNKPSGNTVNCDDNLDGFCGDKWSNFPDSDCNNGCFWPDWYKPYPNSIMRFHWELEDDYMPVNEYELEKDINCSIYNDLYQTNASEIFSYLLEFNFGASGLSLVNARVILGKALNQGCEQASVFGIANLIGKSNEKLYDFNFFIPTTAKLSLPDGWFDENGDLIYTGNINLTQTDEEGAFSLIAPYFPGTKAINLFDVNENALLSINVSDLKPIKYTLGYAGNRINGIDYNVAYSLISQPVKKIQAKDYNVLLG